MGLETAAMGNAALALQVGGALTSAVGSYYGASTQAGNLKAQSSALRSQARIADINARISELGAQSALEQGKHEKARLTLQTGQLKGSQRARLAANGVDLGTGSAAEIQASTDLMKEIDSNTIRYNAVRSAWGYRTQGMNHQLRAADLRGQAGVASATASGISPFGSAATSLLGSASSVATSWYTMSKSGMRDTPTYGSIDDMAIDKGWW